ncbi:hypothetical protein D9758_012451 [Tetrapyrgos nigripes]|uniref:Nephrocystin 3-like N-terminal domain-containing protein n=1 Tax=Tetrapyrgos nigripes TaxID=182062 RepID=A0A8H5CYR6_9AGAR|nr:hypothetical protein D9758_012451 [Tetrapyrgos nigripes]
MDILNKLNPAKKAFYDVGLRAKCIKGTRTQILENILNWVQDITPSAPAGYWMCGMAGTGKSTIVQSVCLKLKDVRLLAGAYFCSRQIPECNDYHKVIPTIAYQLAFYMGPESEFTKALVKVLNQDPDLSEKDPEGQIQKLLIEPWQKVSFLAPVIVIDALDKCKVISSVLEVLIPAVTQQKMPGLKFFLTSHPEQHVAYHFNLNKFKQETLSVQQFVLHNVERSIVREDISKFLQHGLSRLQIQIPQDQMNILVDSSGALFIYAATIIKYLTGGGQWFTSRLRNILNVQRTPDRQQTETLDELYNQITRPKNEDEFFTLRFRRICTPILKLNQQYLFFIEYLHWKALSDTRLSVEEKQQSIKVLHTVITAGSPTSCQTISELMGYELEGVEAIIVELQSVLYINEHNHAIYIFHASFADYLTLRARDKDFCCIKQEHHSLLAGHCFDLMDNRLEFNICNLPSSFLPDNEVPGIGARVAQKLGEAVGYSCVFWGYHLTEGNTTEEINQKMERFLKKKVLFWIEGMNLLRKMSDCIKTLDLVLKVKFQEIEEVQNSFNTGFSKLVKVNTKMEDHQQMGSWEIHASIYCINISPDGEKIVTGLEDGKCIIWNASTGTAIGEPLQGHEDFVNSVAFSPDGTRIASGSSDKTVRIWDTQTGTAIGEPLQGHEYEVTSVAFSPDGARIVSGSSDETVRVWDVQTGTAIGEPLLGHEDEVTSVAFSPDGARIISGSFDETVRIWNAQTGTAIGEPLQGHEDKVTSVAFSPDGARIVSGSEDRTVRIWDAQTGTAIGEPLQRHESPVTSVVFSHDEARIMSGSKDRTVRIWDTQTGTAIGEPL